MNNIIASVNRIRFSDASPESLHDSIIENLQKEGIDIDAELAEQMVVRVEEFIQKFDKGIIIVNNGFIYRGDTSRFFELCDQQDPIQVEKMKGVTKYYRSGTLETRNPKLYLLVDDDSFFTTLEKINTNFNFVCFFFKPGFFDESLSYGTARTKDFPSVYTKAWGSITDKSVFYYPNSWRSFGSTQLNRTMFRIFNIFNPDFPKISKRFAVKEFINLVFLKECMKRGLKMRVGSEQSQEDFTPEA